MQEEKPTNEGLMWDDKLWADVAKYGRSEAFFMNGGGWQAYEELYGESPADFVEDED